MWIPPGVVTMHILPPSKEIAEEANESLHTKKRYIQGMLRNARDGNSFSQDIFNNEKSASTRLEKFHCDTFVHVDRDTQGLRL